MKQEWIDQYNKKCAEFLGWKHSEGTEYYTTMMWGGCGFTPFHMKFNSDWNWIMEVVEKINSFQFGESDYSLQGINIKFLIHSRIGKSSKKSVIESIDQFIDWYNKQKKL